MQTNIYEQKSINFQLESGDGIFSFVARYYNVTALRLSFVISCLNSAFVHIPLSNRVDFFYILNE